MDSKFESKVCRICHRIHCYWFGSYIVDVKDHFPSTSSIRTFTKTQLAIIKVTFYVPQLESVHTWVPACKQCDVTRRNDNAWLAYHDKEVGLHSESY